MPTTIANSPYHCEPYKGPNPISLLQKAGAIFPLINQQHSPWLELRGTEKGNYVCILQGFFCVCYLASALHKLLSGPRRPQTPFDEKKKKMLSRTVKKGNQTLC